MKVVATTKPEVQAEPVTVARPVDGLSFVARDGVPLGVAMDDLTVLLDAARDGIESIAMNDDDATSTERSPTWAVVHHLQFAQALLQAIHSGYIEHRHQAAMGASDEHRTAG